MRINPPLAFGEQDDALACVLGRRVRPEIGFYFAGLVDGEGHFAIRTTGCSFVLQMREDDLAVLEELRREFGGIGSMSTVREARTNPLSRWAVSKKKEVVWLTELFDAFPLRAKKRRDYAIWREAAIAWGCGMSPRELAPYLEQIKEVRVYAPAA